MYGLDESFLSARATLRSAVVCSLLIFAHVLLVTLAVAPRELMEVYPELSGAVKILSGLTFLTILWKVFLLFELADPKHVQQSTTNQVATKTGSAVSEEEEEEESAGGKVYSMAISEVIAGTIALAAWAYHLPSAVIAFEILSARVVKELALLPISFAVATGALLLGHIQLVVQLYKVRKIRATGTRLWTARTGHWDTRVRLAEPSDEKV